MALSIILLAFCKNCTWEILPMLIGAWMLGWLFWYLFHKPKYQNRINDLNSNIGALQTAAHTTSLADNEPNEDFLQLSNELKSAQNLNQDFNAQLTSLRAELDNRQHSSSDFQTNLDSLNEQLLASKENNLKLKADFDRLNAEVNGIQKQNANIDKQNADLNKQNADLRELNSELELLLKEHKLEIEEHKLDSIHYTPEQDPYEDAVRNQFVEVNPNDNGHAESDGTIDVYEDKQVPATSKQTDNQFTSTYGDFLDPTDLKIVEGVGPKIESLLKAADIKNWEELSNTEPSAIQNILNEAGPRYRVHDPKSWPLQARLAFKNDWNVLINLQKEMGGGKTGTKDKNARSKVEKLVMKAKGIKAYAPDDLKIIEGVGPKIEGLLKADGIKNWADLAVTEPTKIKTILTAAGDRYRLADPTTWPKQAALAAKGDWEELKAYQDRLKGGIE